MTNKEILEEIKHLKAAQKMSKGTPCQTYGVLQTNGECPLRINGCCHPTVVKKNDSF